MYLQPGCLQNGAFVDCWQLVREFTKSRSSCLLYPSWLLQTLSHNKFRKLPKPLGLFQVKSFTIKSRSSNFEAFVQRGRYETNELTFHQVMYLEIREVVA